MGIEKMAEMKPRFRLDKIKFMYADQGVSQKLLQLLGNKETCLLMGYYYYLMNEVWPLPDSFGPLVMKHIEPFLRMMLFVP